MPPKHADSNMTRHSPAGFTLAASYGGSKAAMPEHRPREFPSKCKRPARPSRHAVGSHIDCSMGHLRGHDRMQAGSSTPALVDATMISRSPSVLTAEVDGEVVMMSIEQGRYFGLDDIGSDIWKRLETPRSLAELIDRLASDYDADRATIAADVRELLGRMAEQDVVR